MFLKKKRKKKKILTILRRSSIMKRKIRIIEDKEHRPNMISIMFKYFTKYLHEHGFFNQECEMTTEPEKISTDELWAALIEEDKHDLVKILNRVENKDAGFGSIVVPKEGFSKNKDIHISVINWLKDRGVNIIDVKNEESDLEKSLKL
jgi:hypothetical protein